MKYLLSILLLTSFSAQSQSIDSIFMARIAKMIGDSLKANEIRLDSEQFEVVNKVLRMKNAIVKKDSVIKGSNLLTFSDQFDNPVYEKANGSTLLADQIIGIDSIKSADLYSASTKQWGNLLRRTYKFENNKYTLTVFLKRNNHDFIGVRFSNTINGNYCPFVNLSDLTINTAGLAGVSMKAEALPDGWVKVSITATVAAGISYLDVSIVNSTGNTAAIPKGTEKVYVGGEALNIGDPVPYVKTTNLAIQ